MEPDHSANIANFMKAYQDATIVSSQKAFDMMLNYFGTDYQERRIVVKEGDALKLGKHTLNFVAAPMVHWPEVIMTYDSYERALFSADGFGKFGVYDADADDWACEALWMLKKTGPMKQDATISASSANTERRYRPS